MAVLAGVFGMSGWLATLAGGVCAMPVTFLCTRGALAGRKRRRP